MNLDDLCNLLGLLSDDLEAYAGPERRRFYHTFEIQKRSGSTRTICAPGNALKRVQRRLCDEFYDIFGQRLPSHGFERDRSIVTNASIHLGSKFLLGIDLEDFFPSITSGRIRGLLRKPPISLSEDVATCLANITTLNNRLPQGSPCSPVLSNAICAQLDSRLLKLARRNQALYTRYADDITFSSRRPISRDIIRGGTGSEVELSEDLLQIIQECGFKVNRRKSFYAVKGRRLEVTGIVINKRLNVKREYYRSLRSDLHRCLSKTRDGQSPSMYESRQLAGRLEFLGQVRGKEDGAYRRLEASLNEISGLTIEGPALAQLSRFLRDSRDMNRQARGYELERVLNDLFVDLGLECRPSFRREFDGAQIDGAVKVNHNWYLVEAQYRDEAISTGKLSHFAEKVRRGRGARGLVVDMANYGKSLIRWAELTNVPIILFSVKDLNAVAGEEVSFIELLERKRTALELQGDVFWEWPNG